MNLKKYFLFLIIGALLSCGTKNELIEMNIPSLKDVFKNDFLIGAAVGAGQLDDPAHAGLLIKHFSSITCENAMKPEVIHPEENRYDFTQADKIVKFALENKIAVRGHTLIWHNQVPAWFFTENGRPVSRNKLKERMKNHITTIMQRYKGKIYAWDVDNEPIDADQPDGLRRNQWYDILGEEYIELAFRYAREADPDAKLYLNEYDTCLPNKKQRIIELIKKLRKKGITVDGIGMQMHISLTKPSIHDFESAVRDYSEAGLDIQITEMDITVYDDMTSSYGSIGDDVLNEQGQRVNDLFTVLKKYSKNIKSVTFWGMADDHTWLKYFFTKREDWPLPFDNNLKAKPFYWGMVDPSRLLPRINSAKIFEGDAGTDGVEDDAWTYADPLFDSQVKGGFGAECKVLWDDKYLYVLVKTNNLNPDKKNGITIFIDENNNKSAKMDRDDSRHDFKINTKWHDSKDAALKQNGTGYIFETRIPFKQITGAKDSVIGFDVMVMNGKDFVRWNDKKNPGRKSPKYWGNLKFVNALKTAAAYYGKPVIDGVKDEKYDSVKPIVVDKFIQGIEGEKNRYKGAAAKAWALWDEKALYIYMEVHDTTLSDKNSLVYMQDSVEIFVDENNGKTNYYEADDGQYRINFKNETSFGSTGSVNGFMSAARITDGGYAVEAKIPFRMLNARDGAKIGFDLQVNDDQGNGKRDSIAKWNDLSNDSWQSTAGYGILILKK